MQKMRISLKVKKNFQRQECTGEDVISFKDTSSKSYLWFTKSINSKISLIEDGEWFDISANIKGYNSDNTPVLENVRIIKQSKVDMMEINYQEIYDTVKIGDKEQLKYNGYPKVPKYMDGLEMTVVGFTKNKVKVDNGREILDIRYDQIRRVAQEIEKKRRQYINTIEI